MDEQISLKDVEAKMKITHTVDEKSKTTEVPFTDYELPEGAAFEEGISAYLTHPLIEGRLVTIKSKDKGGKRHRRGRAWIAGLPRLWARSEMARPSSTWIDCQGRRD